MVRANPYKLELPGDMVASATFTAADLSPTMVDEIKYIDLRASPFKWGDDDINQGLTQGPH